MRKGKSGIQKRPPGTPQPAKEKEIRIPIKKKTAENILRMNGAVAAAQRQAEDAQRELINHTLPLLTERGIENGRVVQVTEKEPYELVVMVPK